MSSVTSPITTLASIGRLDLLRQLFERVVIPEAVYQELTAAGGIYPGALVSSLEWVEKKSVADRNLVRALQIELDEGEAEAIALAKTINADLVLMDEKIGRSVAARLGIRVVGILGILIEARNRQLISSVKTLIDQMIQNGFFLDKGLYARVLKEVGE